MPMDCPSCGAKCPDAAVFCSSCGEKLAMHPGRVCTHCQTPVPQGRFFCPACGTRFEAELEPPPPPPPPPPPEPERVLYVGEKVQGRQANQRQCLGSLSITNQSISFQPRAKLMKRLAFSVKMANVQAVRTAWVGFPALFFGLFTLALSLVFIFNGYDEGDEVVVAAGYVYIVCGLFLFWLSSTLKRLTFTADGKTYWLMLTGKNKKDLAQLHQLIDTHKGKP